MLYNMNKPSKNMMLSNTEINKMIYEQQQELYAEQLENDIKKEAQYRRINESYYTDSDRHIDSVKSTNKRMNFLQNIKESFITECIMKLYTDSISAPMTSKDKIIARNLVTRFVKENGAGDLIIRFSNSGNRLLSEFGRLSQKYYDIVIESNNKEDAETIGQVKEYGLNQNTVDDFYKEISEIDTVDASNMIKERVADAVQEFLDTNSAMEMDYKNIIDQAKEKIAGIKDTGDEAQQEALIEEYSNIAKSKINELKRTRQKNIFNVMVESLMHKIFTDDSYKEVFMRESKIDMDAVVENTQLMYTMLEMINTTNMVNVNESFIDRYLKSLA